MNYLRLFIIAALGLGLLSFHEYFFGFGELQYNEKTRKIEVSIAVTGHDFEQYLEEKGVEIPPLEECVNQPVHLNKIEKEIRLGFEAKEENQKLQFDLIGMEVNNKDQAIFYLTSREMERPDELVIRFDLLMNYFIKQQNKLTVFNDGKKEFYSFLKTGPERKISL
tara:strand:+ start:37958 stop:38455 length:498 start_codon:yes stop_codon:yes gene_type:complete